MAEAVKETATTGPALEGSAAAAAAAAAENDSLAASGTDSANMSVGTSGTAVGPPAPSSAANFLRSTSSAAPGLSAAPASSAALSMAPPASSTTARLTALGLGGPPSAGPGAGAEELGESIDVDEFQGDILGRKYCVGKTPEGDYFFDYAKPPAGCDLSKIKFFRVTGDSMAEVETELKKLLGKVTEPSPTAPSRKTVAESYRPVYTMAHMSGRPSFRSTTSSMASAARLGPDYSTESGMAVERVTEGPSGSSTPSSTDAAAASSSSSAAAAPSSVAAFPFSSSAAAAAEGTNGEGERAGDGGVVGVLGKGGKSTRKQKKSKGSGSRKQKK